jgi:protein-tyrosine-phosphatase
MTTVLFACVHNAGWSQVAAAFFRDEIRRRVEALITINGWERRGR